MKKVTSYQEGGSGKTTLNPPIYGEVGLVLVRFVTMGKELTSDELYQAGAYILSPSHIFDGLSLEESIALDKNLILQGGLNLQQLV